MDKELTKNRPFDLRIEWSKWLLTLGTAICAALWKPVKDDIPGFKSLLLYSWCSFALSVVIASWAVHLAPQIIEANESQEQKEAQQSVAPSASERQLKLLLSIQYYLFLIGVALTIIFVLYRAAKS